MSTIASHTTAVITISPLLLARLSEFVDSRMGLHFPPARLGDLQRGISSAAGEFGFKDVEACIEWLLNSTLSPGQIEILAGHLTVGETYFFRDKRVFEILETQVLPAILNSRRGKEQHLRIWSAGCSTGEEPYSLGILLARMLPELKDWNITILATDIAPLCLKKASDGVYSEWSFRDTPRWVREGWFEKRERSFAVSPRIRQMVTFAYLNLAEDPFPALITGTNAMDIIFCRNVLMYFSQERAIAVIDALYRCLVDGGWLVISPVEAPRARMLPHLQPVQFPGATLYRKGAKPKEDIRQPSAMPAISQAKPKSVGFVKTRHVPPLLQVKRQEQVPSVPQQQVRDSGQPARQARLLANQGKLADALALCAEALQTDKLNPALYYLQATILQELQRAGDAVAALQRAIYIDQDFVIAHFALGHLLQRQGKNKEAGKHLEKAGALLKSYEHEDILPEAEGISAGRLGELIQAMQGIFNRR